MLIQATTTTATTTTSTTSTTDIDGCWHELLKHLETNEERAGFQAVPLGGWDWQELDSSRQYVVEQLITCLAKLWGYEARDFRNSTSGVESAISTLSFQKSEIIDQHSLFFGAGSRLGCLFWSYRQGSRQIKPHIPGICKTPRFQKDACIGTLPSM